MANVRVRINSAGARAILTSAGVLGDLESRANAIADAACSKCSEDDLDNPPFMAGSDASGNRARATVWASSPHGINSNNKRNTILKSIDAGR